MIATIGVIAALVVFGAGAAWCRRKYARPDDGSDASVHIISHDYSAEFTHVSEDDNAGL